MQVPEAILKRFDQPDEVRTFEKRRAQQLISASSGRG